MGPKTRITIYERAKEFEKEGFYISDSTILMCNPCNIRLEWEKKDTLVKHIKSVSHVSKKKYQDSETTRKRQATMKTMVVQQKRAKHEKEEFVEETVAMFLKSNIPLGKLDHPAVRNYLNKYISGSGDLPCADTLRRNYVEACGENMKDDVRKAVFNKPLVVVADETSDSQGRCVFAVLFRTMTSSASQEVYLASCNFLETANATTCSQAIIDSLKSYNIEYCNVLGLVSDSARYMEACFQAMKIVIGPSILHFQCWAHKVNLVGDIFMKELKDVNSLVSKMKMAFLHSRKMKSAYLNFLKENYPQLPAKLFPNPVITRWNSWFHAVIYIDVYLDSLYDFLQKYDHMNTSTEIILEMMADDTRAHCVRIQCKFINEVCEKFVTLINKLEGSKYPYAHILWDELESLEVLLQRVSDGHIPRVTSELLSNFPNLTVKNTMETLLKSTALKSLTKLKKHTKENPTNNSLKATSQLFNPTLAGAHESLEETAIITQMKNIPYLSNISEKECFEGYEQFHRQLVKTLKEGQTTDILQLLLAINSKYPTFGKAALQAIWAPVNSVDAERFFSKYNLVVTDRRNRLGQSSIETCTMLAFNK